MLAEPGFELVYATIRLATPLIFAALGGVLSERSGTINISLEGKMLIGAFSAAVVTSVFHSPWLGFFAGGVFGLIMAFLYGLLVINLKANQIVAGTGINMLAMGIPPFIAKVLFDVTGSTPALPLEERFQIAPVYVAAVAAVTVILMLRKTAFGLRLAFAGEHPKALATSGVSVVTTRWLALLMAGFLAGLGGACLSIFLSSSYSRLMTGGRGFIALAAIILGRWSPGWACLACLFFGFFDALQIRLQGTELAGGGTIPVQFIQILPYVVTLVVLGGMVGKTRAPKALGIPFGIAFALLISSVAMPQVDAAVLGVPRVSPYEYVFSGTNTGIGVESTVKASSLRSEGSGFKDEFRKRSYHQSLCLAHPNIGDPFLGAGLSLNYEHNRAWASLDSSSSISGRSFSSSKTTRLMTSAGPFVGGCSRGEHTVCFAYAQRFFYQKSSFEQNTSQFDLDSSENLKGHRYELASLINLNRYHFFLKYTPELYREGYSESIWLPKVAEGQLLWSFESVQESFAYLGFVQSVFSQDGASSPRQHGGWYIGTQQCVESNGGCGWHMGVEYRIDAYAEGLGMPTASTTSSLMVGKKITDKHQLVASIASALGSSNDSSLGANVRSSYEATVGKISGIWNF